jgi:hypothetical protein
MTTVASRRPDYQEIQKLIAQYEKAMEEGAFGVEQYVQSLTAQRELGIKKISKSDLPESWEDGGANGREHFVWECRLYAQVDSKSFKGWLAYYLRHPELFRRTEVRKKAQRHIKEVKRQEQVSASCLGSSGVEIYVADIHKVTKLKFGIADAIITDPPYEEKGLDLWSALVEFAGRTLKEHGWLLAMSGQRFLPSVFANMEKEAKKAGLQYVHTLCVRLPGAESSSLRLKNKATDEPERNSKGIINTRWKPILVYSKGTNAEWPSGFHDVIQSDDNDKEFHEWGQSVNVFKTLVEKFTQPKDLVVDPFLGGGTTAVAAYEIGRRIEGFDIDKTHAQTAVKRVKACKK